MPTIDQDDMTRMREGVFFEEPGTRRKLTRFWTLLVLAAIIASAGVVADSTATVIGAMIVAPLMTPILGTMLAVVLGDRPNLVRSIALVLLGATAAIAVGYLLGVFIVNDVTSATNGQVASRVSPRLIDMVAALATGVVGSVALVRRDISDTLPGVAIAISLVPPLTVVGLTAESGAYGEASGALLLFATNVAAILFTGIIVMALYRVHRMVPTPTSHERQRVNRRNAVLVVVAFVLVILVPLVSSTVKIAADTARESEIRSIASTWGVEVGWDLLDVTTGDSTKLRFAGPPPIPDTEGLAVDLRAAGITGDISVEFIPKEAVDLGG